MMRIKQLRQEKQLSLRDLANNLKINYSSLGKYERGEQQPSFDTLIKIADYFNVPVDYLIGRTNCAHIEYQPVSDMLGIDEKTIEILQKLSPTTSKYSPLDYLEAIIQHPQFSNLMLQIKSYLAQDEQGWNDVAILGSNGTKTNNIPAEVMKASSMQIIQTTFKGIVEGIPYSKHFLNKK